MILTMPLSWINETYATEIFNQSFTGISPNLWTNIQLSDDGSQFKFTRAETTYLMIKYNIKPYPNSNITTHYLLACADINETIEPVNYILNTFQDSTSILFTIVAIITSILLLSIILTLLFLSISLSKKLGIIKRLLTEVAYKEVYQHTTKQFSFYKIEVIQNGMEEFVDAVKYKINQLTEINNLYSYYYWGSGRPQDTYYYLKWIEKLYPFNFYHNKQMEWKYSMNRILGGTDSWRKVSFG